MATRERQRLITDLVAEVLNETPCELPVLWLKNKHTPEDFGPYYNVMEKIFHDLGGDKKALLAKPSRRLTPDAYFGGKWNFFFEFDELQHFSTARLKTLEHYPSDLKLRFNLEHYKTHCELHATRADAYRANKVTEEFNFPGGRTAQRAYLDCFRDLLPQLHGLNPTLRITEFEVDEVFAHTERSRTIIKEIIERKICIN